MATLYRDPLVYPLDSLPVGGIAVGAPINHTNGNFPRSLADTRRRLVLADTNDDATKGGHICLQR